MPELSLIIDAEQFAELVRPVLPSAGTDDMLPVITCLQIEAHGEWLMASATDRFTAAVKRVQQPIPDLQWPSGWRALVPVSVVKSILATFKPARGQSMPLQLTVDGPSLTVSTTAGIGLFSSAHMTYGLMDSSFPNLAELFQKRLTNDKPATTEPVGFKHEYLTRFGAAANNGPLRLQFGETTTSAVLVTDELGTFVGMVMPRRLITADERPAARDTWTALLQQAAEANSEINKVRIDEIVAARASKAEAKKEAGVA